MYRWTQRDDEIELTIEDDHLEGIFVEALVALGDLLTEDRGGEPLEHRVEVRGPDSRGLLARWIEELAELADTDGFVPERIVELSLAEERIDALVFGQVLEPRTSIKSVAEDGLELARAEHGWRARVLLGV